MSHKAKNKGGEPMADDQNVIPIRKVDRFYLVHGEAKDGRFIERERVGLAYLKPGSSVFRLRLWMFPKGEYFLAREEGDQVSYLALCRDEYQVGGNVKSQWHKVGIGEVQGNFIRIRFHLLAEDIYLCLFPAEMKAEEVQDVA